MSNQEPRSSGIPSEEEDCEENQQSRDMVNCDVPRISELSLWLQSAQNCSSFPTEEAHETAHYFDDLNLLSSFELPSPLSAQKAGQIPCTKEILQAVGTKGISNTLEKGESSVPRRKHIANSMEMQQIENDKDTSNEDPKPRGESRQPKRPGCAETHNLTERKDTSNEDPKPRGGFRQPKRPRCAETHNLTEKKDTSNEDPRPRGELRQPKRPRCAETHNLTERLRRQKLKEKMKILHQLIPNCDKRDKASTLDAAIRYIRTLQHQIQMMSMGPSFTMFHSPWMMPPQQGVQIPALPQFLGMGYRLGTGSGTGTSSFDFGSGPLALPSPVSSTSFDTLGSAGSHGISEAQSFQNPGGPTSIPAGFPSVGTMVDDAGIRSNRSSSTATIAEDGFMWRPRMTE